MKKCIVDNIRKKSVWATIVERRKKWIEYFIKNNTWIRTIQLREKSNGNQEKKTKAVICKKKYIGYKKIL